MCGGLGSSRLWGVRQLQKILRIKANPIFSSISSPDLSRLSWISSNKSSILSLTTFMCQYYYDYYFCVVHLIFKLAATFDI